MERMPGSTGLDCAAASCFPQPMLGLPFSAPFNWCDHCCGRCTLARDCELEVEEARRRWRHAKCGRDLEDSEPIWEEVFSALQRAFDVVRTRLEQAGLCEDDFETTVVSLSAARMSRFGLKYVREIRRLAKETVERGRLSGVVESGIVLSMKVARIGSQLDMPGTPDAWDWDVVPNLLLVEILDRQVMGEIEKCAEEEGLEVGSFRTVRGSIMTYMAPLIVAVPSSARATMDRLVESGRAPSPFLRAQ